MLIILKLSLYVILDSFILGKIAFPDDTKCRNTIPALVIVLLWQKILKTDRFNKYDAGLQNYNAIKKTGIT